MSDDWSLKDKKYNIRCYANDYGSYYCDEDMADKDLIDYDGSDSQSEDIYKKEDIDILRQKLIEDLTYEKISFKNLDGSKILTDDSQLYKEEGRMDAFAKAIEIINKRFGVESRVKPDKRLDERWSSV